MKRNESEKKADEGARREEQGPGLVREDGSLKHHGDALEQRSGTHHGVPDPKERPES